MLGADERLGGWLGLALGDPEPLGFPDGGELGAFDSEGAPEGTADDTLG